MNLIAIATTIAYGLLSALGGIWGYVKSAVHRRKTTMPALTAFRGRKANLL